MKKILMVLSLMVAIGAAFANKSNTNFANELYKQISVGVCETTPTCSSIGNESCGDQASHLFTQPGCDVEYTGDKFIYNP